MQQQKMSVHAMAEKYVSVGFAILPIPYMQKRPILEMWPKLRITKQQIPEYFKEPCNIGVILGRTSGDLVDVDLDCMEAVAAAPYFLPKTPWVFGRKSKPHSHYLYRCEEATYRSIDDPEPAQGQKASIIELRTPGATERGFQTVVPPSIHESGEEITWYGSIEEPVPDVAGKELIQAFNLTGACALIARRWKEGNRQTMAMAAAGALFNADYHLEEAENILKAICTAAGDEETSKRLDALHDTHRAHEAGEQVTGFPTLAGYIGERTAEKVKDLMGLGKNDKQVYYELNDKGNAKRLADMFGTDLRYCAEIGQWLIWDGKRWKFDITQQIQEYAKKIPEELFREHLREPEGERKKTLHRWAVESGKFFKIQGMIKLTQSIPGIAIEARELDRHKWLLNCRNGTIDLKAGMLRPHQREDLITKIIDVSFDPAATCPIWEGFLGRVMGNSHQAISFLQRAAGYSLTGDVREEVFFFCYGLGRNGKGTFMNTMFRLLDGNDYAAQINPKALINDGRQDTSNEKADLRGARWVQTTEISEGKLDEETVKILTGGDAIKGRRLYHDSFTFFPEFKLWISGNHKPRIKNIDEAIRRRIIMIPFAVIIPEEECDRTLKERLIGELSGVLTWTVKGCLEWQKQGLNPPPEVKQATGEYLDSQDIFSHFFEDCCKIGTKRDFTTAKELHEHHKAWCEREGEFPLHKNTIADKLRGMGCRSVKIQGQRVWLRLILKPFSSITSFLEDSQDRKNSKLYIEEIYKEVAKPHVSNATLCPPNLLNPDDYEEGTI